MDIPVLPLMSHYLHTEEVSEGWRQDFFSQKGSPQKKRSFFCREVTRIQSCPPQCELYLDFPKLLRMEHTPKHVIETLKSSILQKVLWEWIQASSRYPYTYFVYWNSTEGKPSVLHAITQLTAPLLRTKPRNTLQGVSQSIIYTINAMLVAFYNKALPHLQNKTWSYFVKKDYTEKYSVISLFIEITSLQLN